MIKLNLARNCLRYLIRAYNIEEIYLPYYSCNVLWHACQKENCRIKFYHINNNFLPIEIFPKNSFIMYINYFGLCEKNCQYLKEQYPNLIIDNTHAFYSNQTGLASFNSLRKFFNVQNGAYLYTNIFLNESFSEDTFLFEPIPIENDYETFVKNELVLNNQNIKIIFKDIKNYLKKIDFENDKKTRRKRFLTYENMFKKYNKISLTLEKSNVPYCYPFCTDDVIVQEKLNSLKINFLRLWENIPESFPEYKILDNVVALPFSDIVFNKIIENFN